MTPPVELRSRALYFQSCSDDAGIIPQGVGAPRGDGWSRRLESPCRNPAEAVYVSRPAVSGR